jgi:hypothetical protein
MPKKTWKKVKDGNVRHIWGCFEDDCEWGNPKVDVGPTFYQDSGEPMCGCDAEMRYIKTEVKMG